LNEAQWLSPKLIVLSFSTTFDKPKEFLQSLPLEPTAEKRAAAQRQCSWAFLV
jgi:hypothetical protein